MASSTPDNTTRALLAIARATGAVHDTADKIGRVIGLEIPEPEPASTVPAALAQFDAQLGGLADAFEGFADAVQVSCLPAPRPQDRKILNAPAAAETVEDEPEPLDEGPTGEDLRTAVEAQHLDQRRDSQEDLPW